MRFLINNFINGSINIGFLNSEYVEQASPELAKEITEAMQEIEEGKCIEIDPFDKNWHKKLTDYVEKLDQ